MATLPLFDKQVQLTFYDANGNVLAQVATPPAGRKPGIRISGTFVSASQPMNIELRVWNFETSVPLTNYAKIRIQAGYAGYLHSTISGTVWNAFTEQPGPDKITVFQLIVGDPEAWLTTPITRNYPAGSSLQSVLADVAGILGLSLQYYATPFTLPIAVNWNRDAKGLVDKLVDLFWAYDAATQYVGLRIVPFGDNLLCYRGDQGTGVTYTLKYLGNARHSARGVDFYGPWIPTIRPGDTVFADPRYFRQDISGALGGPAGTTFQVIRIDFALATDTDENQAVMITVNQPQASAAEANVQ